MTQFFNNLTRKIEEFTPLKAGEVTLYTCGPTVYDHAHIGNLRAYIFNDLLKRVLVSNNYKVQHVMNITDVDDKTIKKSEGKKSDFEALTQKFEQKFWQDFAELNCQKPTTITRPTEYIQKIVNFIQVLIDKGLAYEADDGSIYFSIEKFPEYGQLAHLDLAGLKPGARVCQDEYAKENPADFVLWKAWTPEDGEIYWDPTSLKLRGVGTKVPKGRPGWSIECSVMAQDALGETIDIHTGGVDLIFPHHENEIAQSQGYSGVQFVRFWLHNEHLLVDNSKMAKSAGNFYTLDDIKEKGFSALDFRYLCLGAHYRSKLNFTWGGLEGAKNSLNAIRELISRDEEKEIGPDIENSIKEAFNDDLDTPKALALLHEAKNPALWLKFDEILGLGLKQDIIKLTSAQVELVKEREKARQAGDFNRADTIRKELEEEGIKLEDTATGTQVLAP